VQMEKKQREKEKKKKNDLIANKTTQREGKKNYDMDRTGHTLEVEGE